MDILIKNGTVINASGRCTADVAVSGGKIISVGPSITPAPHTETIDAAGLLVLPGAVDAHTHFELSFGEFSTADDFASGTRAAACGGVTTVIDFITPEVNESLCDAYRKRNELAAPKACIDYNFHMCLTSLTDAVIDEMESITEAGMPGFKLFMTYAFRLSDVDIYKALRRSKEIGALIMIHAEDHDELESLRAKFIAEGKTDAWYHYLSRPESVETAAVEKAVGLAREADAPLYIVHLACDGGMDIVRKARAAGHHIYAETCPQYLNFTSDVYKREDGRNFICSPPVKGEKSREALWQGIHNGDISVVATDHCPFLLNEKNRGSEDFTKTPNGVMGVETLYPYMLSEANNGRISFERAAGLCCLNPARLFGLDHIKGSVTPGMDADIVLYDPRKEFTVTQTGMHSDLDHTIWEGIRLNGYPVRTYSRGMLVYRDGEFTGAKGHGRFIPGKRFTPLQPPR